MLDQSSDDLDRRSLRLVEQVMAAKAFSKEGSALLLLLAAAALFASPHQAAAVDLSEKAPLFHPFAADLNQLAENEDFWSNVGRYGSYFFSVLLGTAYTAIKPIGGLLRRPVSAVLTISAIIGLYIFVSTTVTAMLGVNSEDAFVLPPQLTN